MCPRDINNQWQTINRLKLFEREISQAILMFLLVNCSVMGTTFTLLKFDE
jgi:hypothetical protein